MLSAIVFTALLAATAQCAEAALRGAGRPTRWPWLIALVASVTWPMLAPFARRSIPESGAMRSVATTLPTIQVVPDLVPATVSWTQWMDVILLTLWAVASTIALARLIRSLVILARIRRASQPRFVDGVPVLVSASVGPAVIGVVQPSVLLPEALLDLEAPLRRLVLRHEQEHCRARDPWIVLGSALALVVVPWNLPLWWIVRRARLALEVDCDARVLATDSNTTQYGKLLLLISQRQRVTVLAPMLAASSSHLEQRIAAMLPIRSSRRHVRITVAVIATVVAGIAACTSRIGDIAGPKPTVATRSSNSDSGQPYFEFQVEKQAQQIPGTGNLRYPAILRSANVQGKVLAQFIVDANGQYEPGTFRVLKSSHVLFTQAVETALPNMRFYPAELKGTHVKQLVQQPFTFSLSSPDSLGARRGAIGVVSASADKLAPKSGGASLPSAVLPGPKTAADAVTVPLDPERVYFEFQVTKQVQQIPGTGGLRYPDILRSANIEGEVLAQFVVGENGQYESGSFKVLKTSHDLFSQAVEAAIPAMRFQPAEYQGTRVKQLVQQPFTFSLSKQ
jgi:TonB family protein